MSEYLVTRPGKGGRLYRGWFGRWYRNRSASGVQRWSTIQAARSVAFAFRCYVCDPWGRYVFRSRTH